MGFQLDLKSSPSITAPCDGRGRHGAVDHMHVPRRFQHPSKAIYCSDVTTKERAFHVTITWI